MRDAVREFARHGVTRLVLVVGHYENQWFVSEGIQLALRELGPSCPLQVMRLTPRLGLIRAAFTVLGKLAEAQGALGYYLGRLRGKRRGLIEYK